MMELNHPCPFHKNLDVLLFSACYIARLKASAPNVRAMGASCWMPEPVPVDLSAARLLRDVVDLD